MSKSLKNMSPEERKKAINRRIKAGLKKDGGPDQSKIGLGFWAAMDARKKGL